MDALSQIQSFHEQETGKYLVESLRLVVDPCTINAELERIPGDIAYWGHLHAQAARGHQESKLVRDRVRARAWARLRSESTVKKLTVDDMKATSEIDPEVAAAEDAVVAAEERVGVLRAAYEGVRAKKEALLTGAGLLRAEMGADPCVRAEARELRRPRFGSLEATSSGNEAPT